MGEEATAKYAELGEKENKFDSVVRNMVCKGWTGLIVRCSVHVCVSHTCSLLPHVKDTANFLFGAMAKAIGSSMPCSSTQEPDSRSHMLMDPPLDATTSRPGRRNASDSTRPGVLSTFVER